MTDLVSFFKNISSKDRDEQKFFEDVMFLAVHEWHLTPNELMEIDIPILYLLLRKQGEFNKEQTKRR